MAKKMIECKTCGKEIAKSAKVCPGCGAKNKKPIFKKWWFWIVVFVVLISLVSGGETEENSVSVNQTQDIVSSSESKPKETEPALATEYPIEEDESVTVGMKNALNSAKAYLTFTAFSYEGLISQLEFEQYTYEEAVYAVDNCGADWNEQAQKSAKNYLSFTAFSYDGLIDQLEFEKFTPEQARYGVDNCGADWNEQAVKSAKNYLELMSFSRDGLIDQLVFEGFTYEQAVYGVEQNGY